MKDPWPQRTDLLVIVALSLTGVSVSLYVVAWPLSLWSAGLAAAMAAITVSDVRRFIIPDWLSLPAIPLGLLATGSLAGAEMSLVAPSNAIGMFIGAGSLYAVREGYRWLRGREGLGLGDVKLAAVAGAWTGAEGFVHVLLAASVSALVVILLISAWAKLRDRSTRLHAQTAVPYGAFLAPSIWFIHLMQSVG